MCDVINIEMTIFKERDEDISRLLLTENCLMHETINVLTEQLFPGKSTISDVLSVTGNQIQRSRLVESFRLRLWKIGYTIWYTTTQRDNTRPYWTVNICFHRNKKGEEEGGGDQRNNEKIRKGKQICEKTETGVGRVKGLRNK